MHSIDVVERTFAKVVPIEKKVTEKKNRQL